MRSRFRNVGDAGSVWTWCVIDADTKLVPTFKVGDRGRNAAHEFVADVASRMAYRVQISTDGIRAPEVMRVITGWSMRQQRSDSGEVGFSLGSTELYEIVVSCMLHESCEKFKSNSLCMIDEKCKKKYSKFYIDQTSTDQDEYSLYRR